MMFEFLEKLKKNTIIYSIVNLNYSFKIFITPENLPVFRLVKILKHLKLCTRRYKLSRE